jgi:catechol 2,3-dioxygenase-like lactoylglutathione lyase family enzyme
MSVVFVQNVDRSVQFFEALGLQMSLRSRSQGWAEFDVGGAILALHEADLETFTNEARIELCFVSEEPLYELEKHCRAQNIQVERSVTDESFGRSMVVRDPDGFLIQINEHDTELYGEPAFSASDRGMKHREIS